MSLTNLIPLYLADEDEWLIIMKFLQPFRQLYPLHVTTGFPYFHSCHNQDHPSDFTALHERRLLFTLAKKEKQRSITGNNSSQLDNNESCEHCVDLGFGLDRRAKEPSKLHCSHTNIPRHLMFKHDYTYKYNQHRRKEIVRLFSSSVISTIVFLGIFYNMWNNQLPLINSPLLRKEHDGLLSIWPSLLGLFGFMVFVCAVAVMILVGAAFTSMQKAMLIFWVILMHLQSATSIIEVLVTLVGGLFMGWYAFGETK